MRLNAPKKTTRWIALVVGAIGIVAHLVTIPVLSGFAFWLVAAAFVLLILATYLKGFWQRCILMVSPAQDVARAPQID